MTRSEEFIGDRATSELLVARKVGRRRLRAIVPLLVIMAVASLIFVLGPVQLLADGPLYGALWAIVAVAVLALPGSRIARSWRTWGRAERGEPGLRFEATALTHQRTVSRRLMRTVVVRRGGAESYVHLLFADDRADVRLQPGPVTLDLFDGKKVTGPARLTQGGEVFWAFTSKEGRQIDAPRRRTSGSGGVVAGPAVAWSAGELGGVATAPRPANTYPDDGWTGGSTWGNDPSWSATPSPGDGGDGGGWGDGGGDFGGGGGDSGGGGGGD